MLICFKGIKPPQFTPQPLNLFMNIPVQKDLTSIVFATTVCGKGEYVALSAEVDCVIAFSACPQVSFLLIFFFFLQATVLLYLRW